VAHLLDELRAAAHEGDAQTAHLGAIKARPRTIRHVPQTGVGAVITLLSTLTASGDTRLMLLMRHDSLRSELGSTHLHHFASTNFSLYGGDQSHRLGFVRAAGSWPMVLSPCGTPPGEIP
jgi:hypothetical protein